MGLDFSTLIYLTCQDMFGREVTITPIASNPSGGAYVTRAIYSTRPTVVQIDGGGGGDVAVLSDQETIIDVRDNEIFDAGQPVPQQGDLVTIPADGNVPAEGDFEVTDVLRNGGGETTLVIRKWESAAP